MPHILLTVHRTVLTMWALGRQQDVVQHMRALPHGAVADALATVRASQASVTTKRAFEFLVLTAARSGEVRLATWDEIDAAGAVWTISAARMKAKREHRVPLCRRALEILDAARAVSNGDLLVFPSGRGKRLNDMALSGLLKTLEIPAVPHGFRSTFRDWAAPLTPLPVRAGQLQQVGQPADAQLVPAGVHRGGAGQFGPDDRLDQRGAPLDVAFDDGGVEGLDVIDVQHSLQVDVLGVHGKVSSSGRACRHA